MSYIGGDDNRGERVSPVPPINLRDILQSRDGSPPIESSTRSLLLLSSQFISFLQIT